MDSSWGVIIALIVLYVLIFALITIVVVFYIHGGTVGPQGPIGPTGPPGNTPGPLLPITGTVTNQTIQPNQQTLVNWNEGTTFTLPAGVYTMSSVLTYQAGQSGTRSIAVWVRDKGQTNMTDLLGMNTVSTTLITLPLGFNFTLTSSKEVSVVTWHTNPTSLMINGTMRINRDVGSPTNPIVSLFHWNPHWACFRNKCCYEVAEKYINDNLLSRKVDFANIIELEDEHYQPPSGYKVILGHCGAGSIQRGDVTTMIYNSNLWRTIGSAHQFCINTSGTEGGSGSRPTVIQQFQHISSGLSLYVVGAHFTHVRNTYVSGLKRIFNNLGITASSNIAFMADTNQNGSSEQLITDILGARPHTIQATAESGTCCYDGFHLRYDRIITTFGSHMSTYAPPFNEVIPNHNPACDVSEMHLPIFGVVT